MLVSEIAPRRGCRRIAKETAEGFTVGDPREGKFKLGPLVSAAQEDHVVNYIKKGIEEGAVLVTGGPEMPEGVNKGFFVRPTVFANVNNRMTIAQEEIFGPVLSIIPYEDEENAVRIAVTIYGLQPEGDLAGSVERASRVARRLPHGSGRDQRRRVQPHGSIRRIQTIGSRPRTRQVWPRRIPRN